MSKLQDFKKQEFRRRPTVRFWYYWFGFTDWLFRRNKWLKSSTQSFTYF